MYLHYFAEQFCTMNSLSISYFPVALKDIVDLQKN